jgi:hypothetical protein
LYARREVIREEAQAWDLPSGARKRRSEFTNVTFICKDALPELVLAERQVYKAVLRDTGQEVAIKVQRPSVEPIIFRDLFIFRQLVRSVLLPTEDPAMMHTQISTSMLKPDLTLFESLLARSITMPQLSFIDWARVPSAVMLQLGAVGAVFSLVFA